MVRKTHKASRVFVYFVVYQHQCDYNCWTREHATSIQQLPDACTSRVDVDYYMLLT